MVFQQRPSPRHRQPKPAAHLVDIPPREGILLRKGLEESQGTMTCEIHLLDFIDEADAVGLDRLNRSPVGVLAWDAAGLQIEACQGFLAVLASDGSNACQGKCEDDEIHWLVALKVIDLLDNSSGAGEELALRGCQHHHLQELRLLVRSPLPHGAVHPLLRVSTARLEGDPPWRHISGVTLNKTLVIVLRANRHQPPSCLRHASGQRNERLYVSTCPSGHHKYVFGVRLRWLFISFRGPAFWLRVHTNVDLTGPIWLRGAENGVAVVVTNQQRLVRLREEIFHGNCAFPHVLV
mmetsp:Transcript_88422/g.175808  ORF Transcript_88422/g.175808 Transcript_88422/m.175808 type:complete len:293 (-) Transcript_88422:335-1213(-)